MKRFTYKQVSPSIFIDASFRPRLVKPQTCGIGEFVTIGTRNAVTAVFIKSMPLGDDIANYNALFNLHHPAGMSSIIQYNASLGGYLYTWANL